MTTRDIGPPPPAPPAKATFSSLSRSTVFRIKTQQSKI